MPMIDVYTPSDLFPADADEQLGHELTHAVLRAEGVTQPGPFHLDNTAAFIHRLPATAISTANTPSSRTVRPARSPPGPRRRVLPGRGTGPGPPTTARGCTASPRPWGARSSSA